MASAQGPVWIKCQACKVKKYPGADPLYKFSTSCIFPLFLLLAAGGLWAADTVSPVFPGLDRDGIGQRARGLVLIGEYGCIACHPAGNFKAELESRMAPRLDTVGTRISPA